MPCCVKPYSQSCNITCNNSFLYNTHPHTTQTSSSALPEYQQVQNNVSELCCTIIAKCETKFNDPVNEISASKIRTEQLCDNDIRDITNKLCNNKNHEDFFLHPETKVVCKPATDKKTNFQDHRDVIPLSLHCVTYN